MTLPSQPDRYWVVPGSFLAGAYPGARDEADARLRLGQLLDAGIRVFVDLTEKGELPPYADWLGDEALARGARVTYVRRSIRDLGVPTRSRMREILRDVDAAIDAGLPVYVHCWAGIGRTGTVVGCWLAERQHGGEPALRRLAALRRAAQERPAPSPESPRQIDFVRQWHSLRRRDNGLSMAVTLAIVIGIGGAVSVARDRLVDPANRLPAVQEPWPVENLLAPGDLATELAGHGPAPTIVYVGFTSLFRPGHIKGATLHGPASTPAGLEDLRRWASLLPPSTRLVIYCGCCPLVQCPNVRPAFKALQAMGFTNVRVVSLPSSFGADWVEKGYPVEHE